MFNTTMNKQSTNIKFENHSASGLLCKSMLKSKIIRFDRNSNYEEWIFSINPHIVVGKNYNEKDIPIIVLQVLLVHDKTYIVEYINEDDFYEEMGIGGKEE